MKNSDHSYACFIKYYDLRNRYYIITFTEPVILEITKRMLGEEVAGIDDTVTDMVWEITNMVTGGAKRILSEHGYRFDMAIPSVVSVKNHVVHHKSRAPIIIIHPRILLN